MRNRFLAAVIVAVVAAATGALVSAQTQPAPPRFEVDPSWPKPLPNRWLMGQAAGVAVDRQDHIWVVQRPRTLTEDEKGATLTPPRNDLGLLGDRCLVLPGAAARAPPRARLDAVACREQYRCCTDRLRAFREDIIIDFSMFP